MPDDPLISIEKWSNDRFVVTVDEEPIGPDMLRDDAEKVASWLRTSWDELIPIFEETE